MKHNLIGSQLLRPFAGKWSQGLLVLTLWTAAFMAMPAVSGWFLAICSVTFITASTTFSYLIPSAVIRLLSIFRTATRYYERLENHKTTLDAQQRLQLKIFESVARLPYFRKQVNNNSTLLENSTHGVEQILNHILLWLLPLTALVIALLLYFGFLLVLSQAIALEFLISAAILLFLIPQFVFRNSEKYYNALKVCREEHNQALMESFRGRIEISKHGMEGKVIQQYEQQRMRLEQLENKLQNQSFHLQLIAGLGFSYLAALLLWNSGNHAIDASTAVGLFFGMMAQAELSEMLFSGKSEKSAVKQQIKDVQAILTEGAPKDIPTSATSAATPATPLERVTFDSLSAHIPETKVQTNEISLALERGDWVALYGETGKGKTTLLNSLFYPEYRRSGTICWNEETEVSALPVPQAVYVTQKAYLLTGTLRENFEGYADEAIEKVLQTVDLSEWRASLPDGLESWLGEHGEILSGGQRKKLLLAQALLKDPQLLVVDEPTAGISAENAIAIFRNIRQQHPNITILMATHLQEFEGAVDKVIKL